jgi:hypothetical protein
MTDRINLPHTMAALCLRALLLTNFWNKRDPWLGRFKQKAKILLRKLLVAIFLKYVMYITATILSGAAGYPARFFVNPR